jgi:uncharacterized protein YijF (DUF1287 family)
MPLFIRFNLSNMPRLLTLFVTLSLLSSSLLAQTPGKLGAQIATGARGQIGVTTSYDPSYVTLAYPGGDVPSHTGVCTDVVVRALRTVGIDLQKEVHEDMRKNFTAYPQNWGLKRPDKNIDHRRVPNLMRYFERKHIALGERGVSPDTYLPGDIVAWRLDGGLLHIGVVSDKKSGPTPLMIHNIGIGAQEENVLFAYTVIGHYRIK